MFKQDKIYEYRSLKSTITKLDLLEFLSGDTYLTSSHIFNDDTQAFLASLTNYKGASIIMFYYFKFDVYINEVSK